MRRAALGRIELHLPLAQQQALVDAVSGGIGVAEGGGGGGEDTLRTGVMANVDAWITELFEAARHNVSINGINGDDEQFTALLGDDTAGDGNGTGTEEYEVYDTRLAARITALYANIERLNLELADTRRVAVKDAARKFGEGWVQQGEEIEEALKRSAAVAEGQGAEDMDGVVEGVKRELWLGKGRNEEVRETWEGAVVGLRGLRGGIEETMERAERARRVVGVLQYDAHAPVGAQAGSAAGPGR